MSLHETGPWFDKGWGPLSYSVKKTTATSSIIRLQLHRIESTRTKSSVTQPLICVHACGQQYNFF